MTQQFVEANRKHNGSQLLPTRNGHGKKFETAKTSTEKMIGLNPKIGTLRGNSRTQLRNNAGVGQSYMTRNQKNEHNTYVSQSIHNSESKKQHQRKLS